MFLFLLPETFVYYLILYRKRLLTLLQCRPQVELGSLLLFYLGMKSLSSIQFCSKLRGQKQIKVVFRYKQNTEIRNFTLLFYFIFFFICLLTFSCFITLAEFSINTLQQKWQDLVRFSSLPFISLRKFPFSFQFIDRFHHEWELKFIKQFLCIY